MCRYAPWLVAAVLGWGPARGVAAQEGPVTTVVFGVPAHHPRVVVAPAPAAPEAGTGDDGALRVRPCPAPATSIVRAMGGRAERRRVVLLDCEGRVRPEARRVVSVLARPRTRPAPTLREMHLFRDRDGADDFVARDIRLLHPALLARLQLLADRFPGHAIQIFSGYRPRSAPRSRDHHGRALDLRVEGVPRGEVRDFLVGLPRTGVGWYPNSTFVHLDVRERSAYWVDLSGPTEPPRYLRGEARRRAGRRLRRRRARDARPPAEEARPAPPGPARETASTACGPLDRAALEALRRGLASAFELRSAAR